MADYNRQPFFSSPRLFTGFVSKKTNDPDSVMSSPTSILDGKPFSVLKNNPFWSETNKNIPKPESKSLWEKKAVGLGLIDALIDEKSDSNLSKMVIFGSQLKIQVPPPVLAPTESPKSPVDFGIKTKSSISPAKKSPYGSGVFRSISVSEMELSEDYTCVISYGPNPRTTHIFDDCIVESCCGVVESRKGSGGGGGFTSRPMSCYPSESFLSFCYNCKKNLGQGKDIYMYRGEKAFCSSDCRYKEMMLEEEEEGTEASEFDDVYGNGPASMFRS